MKTVKGRKCPFCKQVIVQRYKGDTTFLLTHIQDKYRTLGIVSEG